jgi:hypothetical protein
MSDPVPEKHSASVRNPELLRGLLEQAIHAWLQFDSDEPISGAELVEWFANWRRQVQQVLTLADQHQSGRTPAESRLLDHLQRVLCSGTLATDKHSSSSIFIVLTRDGCLPPNATGFEAWAYAGPLDFNEARPLRFGAGATIVKALEALGHYLSPDSDSSRSHRRAR